MRKWASLAVGIALGMGLIWLFGVGTPGAMNFPRPFSSERWKSAPAWSYVRCAMVGDLRRRINGKARAEVVDLLGPDIDGATEPPRVYGLCPSFADYYILEINWVGDRVESTIVRDA